jgi:hypothetical protein
LKKRRIILSDDELSEPDSDSDEDSDSSSGDSGSDGNYVEKNVSGQQEAPEMRREGLRVRINVVKYRV